MDRIRRIRQVDPTHNFTLVCRDLSEISTYSKVGNAAYRLLKQQDADEQAVSENRLNRMGYTYLGQGEIDHALAVFKINVELYPDAWNCHDSLGDAYMRSGDNDLAIRSFRRSLELNPNNQHGIQMLEQLEGGL